MALLIRATATVNQASDTILLTDTTLPYDAYSNVGGYGAPSGAIANNVATEIIPTSLLDGSVGATILLDGTTVPASNFIPKNALFRTLSITDLSQSGDTF